jgi:diguanylate cyclase (GGDEF)-like protein
VHKPLSYDQHIRRIILFSTLISLLVVVGYGVNLQVRVLDEYSKADARKTSRLAFEAIYSAMERGWKRHDITPIIDRLNSVDERMQIDLYRSERVIERYGPRTPITGETALLEAMAGEEQFVTEDATTYRFYYPIAFEKSCLECHANASSGEIAGVMTVRFPLSGVRFAPDMIFNALILLIAVVMAGVFFLLYVYLRRHLVNPLKHLLERIRYILAQHDLTSHLVLKSGVKEVKDIEESFNHLLSSLNESEAQLKALSLTDHLTGIANRKRFEEAVRAELVRSKRYEEPFSVMILDLNNFKPVNDTYGHLVGDKLLIEVAALLRANIRVSDLAARLGGDEFVLLLINTDAKRARLVREKLEELIAQHTFEVDGHSLKVGVSTGTATWPEDGADLEKLLDQADTRMYRVKR